MDAILDFVVYGENIRGDKFDERNMGGVLAALEQQLQHHGYEWPDVSLLILANSKKVRDKKEQINSDSSIAEALDTFCAAHKWYPPLLGATTLVLLQEPILSRGEYPRWRSADSGR